MKGQNNFIESLFDETINNFITVIDRFLNGMSMNEKAKNFIARFYAYSFTYMMIDWIKDGMKDSPEEFMQPPGK